MHLDIGFNRMKRETAKEVYEIIESVYRGSESRTDAIAIARRRDYHLLLMKLRDQFVDYKWDWITCPNCLMDQRAKVYETVPWADYTHLCEHCDYFIMESEWDEMAEKGH